MAQETRLIGGVPVCHRHPLFRDVPPQNRKRTRPPHSARCSHRSQARHPPWLLKTMMTMNKGAFAGSRPHRVGVVEQARFGSCPSTRHLRAVLLSLSLAFPVHFCLAAHIEGAIDSPSSGEALEQVRKRHSALRVCIIDDAEQDRRSVALTTRSSSTWYRPKAADWRGVIERDLSLPFGAFRVR